jgi:cell division septation protein DedD
LSEDRGPVHYQISITGRQAGVFFLALLLALGLSFFFGMKTGAAAKKGPETIAALAAASDLPVPTLPPEEKKGARPADEATSSRPEDRKLGFEPNAAADLKKTPAPEPPPPTAKPALPTATPAPKPAVTKPPPAKKEGPLWVQVLATKSATTADDLAKRLKDEGFAADVSVVPGKAGWFRVRVGPFNDRARAEATAKKIQQVDKSIKNRPMVTP